MHREFGYLYFLPINLKGETSSNLVKGWWSGNRPCKPKTIDRDRDAHLIRAWLVMGAKQYRRCCMTYTGADLESNVSVRFHIVLKV
jgi:hypothetical protein